MDTEQGADSWHRPMPGIPVSTYDRLHWCPHTMDQPGTAICQLTSHPADSIIPPMCRVTTERWLVLASASPRRRELIAVLGLEFEACSANVCETIHPGESAIATAQRLAQAKATTVAERMNPRGSPLVIGADTIVVLDGEAVGKPKDATEAEAILRRLHGREHEVLTALSLVAAPNADPLGCVARTTVSMREYTSEEMSLYVCSGSPLDKAGAYAIQDPVFRPAAGLTGCFANVIGLPLCHLTVLLRKLGIDPARDVAAACQEKTGHICTVFSDILDRHSQSSQPRAATGEA